MAILAHILRDEGAVDERQLETAIQHQVLFGGRLGTSLLELGYITEERLTTALARVHGVRGALPDLDKLPADPAAILPAALASRHKVFPYKVQGKTLFLLMVDPRDHQAVAAIGFSRGFIVKPMVIPEFRMVQLLRDHYGVDEAWRYEDLVRPTDPLVLPSPETAEAHLEEAASRDEVVGCLIALARGAFRRALFFIVREPWALGWDGAGEGIDRAAVRRVRLALDTPSAFQTVVRDRTVFVGPLADAAPRGFLQAMGKRGASGAVLFPVVVRGRVVNVVYGDNGPAGAVDAAPVSGLLLAAQKASRAYLRIIRRKVAEARQRA